MNDKQKKYYLILINLIIGIILIIYGILNPVKPINNFNSGDTKITIIEINKLSQPNYVLIFGIVLSILSVFLFIFNYFSKPTNQNTSKTLTKKEIEIFELLKQGKTNKEIASELFISVSTVKTHINNIFKKLNISNRNEITTKN